MADPSDSQKVETAEPTPRPRGNGFPRAFGNYLLLQRLARGGMGEVFLAKHGGIAGIEKHCVVKTLRAHFTADREYVTRFIDEARIVVQLAHRNIAQIFDVGRVNRQYYLAMEYIAGSDLRTIAERVTVLDKPLPENVALHIVSEVLEALDYAHRHIDPATGERLNLVHRDVSPQNVMVSFEGEVKLIDFGLAHSTMKVEQTQPNVVMGKMAYMSPEQARADELDGRADLFAAAVLLYELLVGERYYEGLSFDQIWSVAGTGGHQPQRWDAVPAELAQVLSRALKPNAADRFATGADFKDALVEYSVNQRLRPVSRELRQLMAELFDSESAAHHELIKRFQNVSAIGSMASPPAPEDESQSFAVRDVESFLDQAPIPDRTREVIALVRDEPTDVMQGVDAATVVGPADLTDRDPSTHPSNRDPTDESEPLLDRSTLIQSDPSLPVLDRSAQRQLDPTTLVRDLTAPSPPGLSNHDFAPEEIHAGPPPAQDVNQRLLAVLAGITISLAMVAGVLFWTLDGLPPGPAAPVPVDNTPPPAVATGNDRAEAAATTEDNASAAPATPPAEGEAPGATDDNNGADTATARDDGDEDQPPAEAADEREPADTEGDDGAVGSEVVDDDDKRDRKKRRRARRATRTTKSSKKVVSRPPPRRAEPAPEKPKLSPAGLKAYSIDALKVWRFLKPHCDPIVACARNMERPNMSKLTADEIRQVTAKAVKCAKQCKREGS